MAKVRLDQLLVERGLASSRTAAAAIVMAGEVRSQGRILDKPGHPVDSDTELEVIERKRYVSRGGDKLASVAEALKLDFSGKTVLDVGSSTGGFTDYALQNGAARVVCVDVGTGQLDFRLRQDPRVEVHEKTDIRRFETEDKFDIIVMDVSFVSLRQVLRPAAEFVKPGGIIVAMAKPQFEAGRAIADKFKGIIKDPEVRQQVLQDFEEAVGDDFTIEAWADSGLAGAEGNLERFYLLRSVKR